MRSIQEYRIGKEQHLDQEEIVGFLSSNFGTDPETSRRMVEVTFRFEPSFDPSNLILARSEEGQLIGAVRIVEREVLVDGVALCAGGISSVAVDEAWRGKGVCSSMMQAAVEDMAARGIEISFLYGRKVLDGFYTRFGYRGIGRYVDLKFTSAPKKDVLKVAPFAREHLDLCMGHYAQNYHALSGSIKRDPSVWEFLLQRTQQSAGHMKINICRLGAQPVGYLVIQDNKLTEICLPEKAYQGLARLLEQLGLESLTVHPRHPVFLYSRKHFNTTMSERFALDGGYMGRIIRVDLLLKKLAPAVARRAGKMGLKDSGIALLGHRIDLKTGDVAILRGAEDVTADDPGAFVPLLLGARNIDSIAGLHWDQKKPWIPQLFPELYYHTSYWDEI